MQSDLSGVEKIRQETSEGQGSSGSCMSYAGCKFHMENLWIFLVASGRGFTALWRDVVSWSVLFRILLLWGGRPGTLNEGKSLSVCLCPWRVVN